MMGKPAGSLILLHWRALLKQEQALGVSQKKGLTAALLVPEAARVEDLLFLNLSKFDRCRGCGKGLR